MWQQDAGPPVFNREQRRFLTRAARAYVPADVLLERVAAIVGSERPTRGRQTFLARQLHAQRLFAEYEDALAFADSYYTLAKAGQDFTMLTWDWE